ncbi:MAG: ester cyclase [Pseudomonadota bacterium]
MIDPHASNKAAVAELRSAQYDFDPQQVRKALVGIGPSARFRMCAPFGDLDGPDAFYEAVYAPLLQAWPDLERRDWIVMAGQDTHGHNWVGCGGHYTGTFLAPWLDIPPSGHVGTMRFHEFYRFEAGMLAEAQILWDIPEVMMQSAAWPLAPSLGREYVVPGPATNDGIVEGPHDEALARRTRDVIVDMLEHLKRHPSEGGPDVMEMPRFWHERMAWYGPAGIGTGRGIAGFRNWHQIPFLAAMPDRGLEREKILYHFFGDGNYAAVTGWPNMIQTLSHPGWMGIAPAGKRITMRSLDFWRLGPDGRIRENWVLVDLIDMYAQIGVDPFARMREFNKARLGFDPATGTALK